MFQNHIEPFKQQFTDILKTLAQRTNQLHVVENNFPSSIWWFYMVEREEKNTECVEMEKEEKKKLKGKRNGQALMNQEEESKTSLADHLSTALGALYLLLFQLP